MKLKLFRLALLPLIFFILPYAVDAARYSLECSGACAANCSTWYLTYEVDCNCKVTVFESFHFYGMGPWGPVFDYNTHESEPGWVGMNAAALGCDCNACG
ncbi:MAG TPA: hypothetical protein PKE06_07235 [Flavilitoribacter sp.]|mgnify:CR=1 FL=1|nr:hypothetical protein [Flavilitoribacter sp.]HMQ87487.1 hypothetical protein [Flavilitoribacter sp.]